MLRNRPRWPWLPVAVILGAAAWKDLKADSEKLFQQQRYFEAVAQAEAAVRQAEVEFGPDHVNVAASLNDLAGMYRTLVSDAYLKYTQTAPALYQRALAICEKTVGSNDLNVATILNNLGELYRVQGDFDRAEPLYQQALDIFQARLGSQHPLINELLEKLADLRQARASRAPSQPLADPRRMLALQPSGAASGEAQSEAPVNQQAETEVEYKWKLTALESALGPDHPTVAALLVNLADLYKREGRYAEAETLYHRILKIEEQEYGVSHEKTAVTVHRLAELYSTQHRWNEAELMYRRLADTLEQLFGPK